jgi:hypothetical protein
VGDGVRRDVIEDQPRAGRKLSFGKARIIECAGRFGDVRDLSGSDRTEWPE